MNKIVSYLIYLLLFFIWFYNFTFAEDNLQQVYKIESYKHEDLLKQYYLEQYWSSIYMGNWLIYTNAHVVLDDENEPIWNYRVCKTIDFKENAKCFSVWELLYYDTVNDLAVLKVNSTENKWVNISKKELSVWDTVKVYWYPSNWGETITYTEWKISGYEKWLYKIDANFDAGNSWGWVFDSDWNLIWMAVSVWVWYSTLWYVIPLDKINNFIANKWENIEKYDKKPSSSFVSYTLWKNSAIGANTFKNDYISLSNYVNNWLFVNDYSFDTSKENYVLSLADKNNETSIHISNFTADGKTDYTINDYYEKLKKEYDKNKDYWNIKLTKYNKIKVKNKDATIDLAITDDNEVYLKIIIEQSKNNFVQVYISTTNLKNKSFLKWFKLVLKNLELLTKEYNWNNSNYLIADNLKISKNDWFYLLKSMGWWTLTTFWDINVKYNTYSKDKIEDYEDDYTLTNDLIENYNYMKQYYILYNYSIKKTKKWENYLYMYWINNKEKDWIEDKKEDKYFITATFYDKIDDKYLYSNKVNFTFNNEKSKDEILKLLDTVETSSWDWVFPIWDMKVWENIVETQK